MTVAIRTRGHIVFGNWGTIEYCSDLFVVNYKSDIINNLLTKDRHPPMCTQPKSKQFWAADVTNPSHESAERLAEMSFAGSYDVERFRK